MNGNCIRAAAQLAKQMQRKIRHVQCVRKMTNGTRALLPILRAVPSAISISSILVIGWFARCMSKQDHAIA
jgi:hypothetical protein